MWAAESVAVTGIRGTVTGFKVHSQFADITDPAGGVSMYS